MQRVPQPKRVLRLLGELHDTKSTRELSSWTLNVFSNVIGRDFAVLTGFGSQGEMRSVTLADGIDPGLLPVYAPAIASRIEQDLPGLRWMVGKGAARYTGRITDLVSQSQFEETALYNEAYRSLQMRCVLGTIFRTPGGGMLSLAMGRGGRDFTEGQSETLRVVSQHLEIAMDRLRQIEALTARREAGEEFARFEALREMDRWYFTAIDAPSALTLAKYFGEPDRFRVPNVIETCLETGPVSSLIAALDGSGWIVKTMHRAGCQASVQIEREPAITADSIDLLASLTIREREVLGWIARGKRDAEIALILGMAPRTASKHVEHILSKLSCETRAGAIAIFLGT